MYEMHTGIKEKKLFLLVSLAAALLCLPDTAMAQQADTLKQGPGISLRTNLLWDAIAEPNLGIEIPVGDHVTVGANAALKAWPRWLAWDWDRKNNVHWRNFAVVPEVRYYFDEVYQGFFAGADAVYTHFNVGNVEFPFGLYPDVKTYREQGSYWAGGLFAGYAWWPWQHWRLEVEAGAALGLAAYDRYACPTCGTRLSTERDVALVPKLAVNLAYNPVSRDKARARRERREQMILSGRDTITVFTPPVAFVVNLKEVKAPQSAGDRLSKEKPWVLPISLYRPLDYLTRPGKDSILYVVFPVNSDRLSREFPTSPVKDLHRNARMLDDLQMAVETIRDDESTSELLVSIVGLASIEGPQAPNDSLSIRRARSVADYLNDRTFVSQKYFETIGKGEAWDWFKDQLEAIPDGGEGFSAQEVRTLLDIVYNVKDADERERRIKADASLYKKVMENLLGDQRNSGYIRVYYNNRPDQATEKINGPIFRLLNAKQYAQAVQEIQGDKAVMARVGQDPEAANAYAVALYFTALDKRDQAAEEEAIGLLEKAAREGSSAAAENLKGLASYGAARKEFENWSQLTR